MRNIGLGLLALIISLNLFFLGNLEVKNISTKTIFFENQSTPGARLNDLLGDNFDDGILQRQFNTNQLHDVVRKFPVTTGLLSLILNPLPDRLDTPDSGDFVSFLSSKDLSLQYRNLRI